MFSKETVDTTFLDKTTSKEEVAKKEEVEEWIEGSWDNLMLAGVS
jgi:hypothetical protein